jgi:hypothetical protein
VKCRDLQYDGMKVAILQYNGKKVANCYEEGCHPFAKRLQNARKKIAKR